MKSPAVEGKSAWPQTLLNENDNNNSNSINCVAEGQKKEFKAELAETKVTEEDAVKVMLKFSADNLIKLELITGSLEKQQQLQHQVNETNVKDATTTVVEHAKPSLKIVMHRPHAVQRCWMDSNCPARILGVSLHDLPHVEHCKTPP